MAGSSRLTRIIAFTFLFTFLATNAKAQQAPGSLSAKKPNLPIAGSLFQLLEIREASGKVEAASFASVRGMEVLDDRVAVTIRSAPGKTTHTIRDQQLLSLGASLGSRSEHSVDMMIPIGSLRALSTVPGVFFTEPRQEPVLAASREGVVVSEGVGLIGASNYHSEFYFGSDIYGHRVKVAVVDGGFLGLSAAISAGELPPDSKTYVVGGGSIESGTDHGIAVAEALIDVAPLVDLYLIKVTSDTDLSAAVDLCISLDIEVMNVSLGYTGHPGDGTGSLASYVTNAYENGILWINSAGNSAKKHYYGKFSDNDADGYHNYLQSDELLPIWIEAGVPLTVALTWRAWPATYDDYDLHLLDFSQNLVAQSTTAQSTYFLEPKEMLIYTPTYTGVHWVVIEEWSSSVDHLFDIFITSGEVQQYGGANRSILSPADAIHAVAVGAIDREDWTTGPPEDFSSKGPTTDGRIKPDISGPDNCNSLTYGHWPGTSASSPHVAGAAALLKSVYPQCTVDELRTKLLSSTIDMGVQGMDHEYGYGRLVLPEISTGQLTAFSAVAGDESVSLSWTNPTDIDFQSTLIRYSYVGYPENPIDGVPIENGNNGFFFGNPGEVDGGTHTGLASSAPIYYSAFATNGLTFSPPKTTSATPFDATAPANVTALSVLGSDGSINITWTNPSTPDIAGTLVRYSTSAAPSGPTAGTAVPNGNNGFFVGGPGTAGSFTHNGLTNGTKYYYSAFAYDEVPNYSSGASASGTPADGAAPASVSGFNAFRSDGSLNLTWTNPSTSDFAGTLVRYSTSTAPSSPTAGKVVPNGNNGLFAGGPGTAGNFTHSGLTNGTTYYYSAFAYDEVPNYASHTSASGTPADLAAPAGPSGLTASAGNGEATLSWTNPADADFSGTLIRYSTSAFPSGPTDGTAVPNGSNGVISDSPGSKGNFNHTGLTNGTTYYYAAFAFDEVPNYSAAVTTTVNPGDTQAPAAVTSFTSSAGDEQVSLNWQNPATGDFTKTVVRYSTSAFPANAQDGTGVDNGSGGVFSASPGSKGSFEHTALTNGQTYFYAAFASDAANNYAAATTTSAMPADVSSPAAVSGFSVAASDGQAAISWTNPNDGDFESTLLRYSTTSAPSGPTDGAAAPNGSSGEFAGSPGSPGSFTHTGLTNGTTYFYAAFAHDEVPNYAAAVTGSGTPQDVSAPSAVASLTAEGGEGEITISWTQPNAGDLAGTVLRYSTSGAVSAITDGTAVPNGASGLFTEGSGQAVSFTHTGLANGVTHFYGAFAYDEVPNYSSVAQASAAPEDNTAPSLVTAIFQNPYATDYLDVYLVASEALDGGTIDVTVADDPVAMSLNDADEHIWKGDYTLNGSGVMTVAATASDLAGNSSSVAAAMSAAYVLAGSGAQVESPDGRLMLDIEAGTLRNDGYVLTIPHESGSVGGTPEFAKNVLQFPDADLTYTLSPADALQGQPATLTYRYAGEKLDVSPDRLYLTRVPAGSPLASYVDPSTGTVSATIRELGTYKLAIGAPGTSPVIGPGFARLYPSQPNPFNPVTTIRLELGSPQYAQLEIFSVAGVRVRTLLAKRLFAGVHDIVWDATDDSGGDVASGVYLYRLTTDRSEATRRMVLVR